MVQEYALTIHESLPGLAPLWGHVSQRKVVLWWNAERVGHAIEEREHRDDVDRLGDLLFAPAMVTEPLNVINGGAVSPFGNQLGVLQQRVLGGR